MSRAARYCLTAAVLLLSASGCVREGAEGAAQTFTYELWVPLAVLVGGIVSAPAGWFLRTSNSRLGWGLLVAGPIAAMFFAPSLFRDRAVLEDNAFHLRSGIWGLTAVHEIRFDDLKQVRIVAEETRGRRGRKEINYYFVCERHDGSSAKLPMNNAVAEAAAPHFLKKVSELRIPILDET